MNLISKQISELRAYAKDRKGELAKLVNDAADTIETLSTKLSAANLERSSRYYNGGWIPFKTRALTDEEKEEHPEWDCILECKLPEDGQRILVSINLKGHEEVQYDEFYSDDGSYLDSGYEIGSEAVAWMPLPKPYREE